MSIYNEFDVIDDFEIRFGHEKAMRRTCELMVDYLDSVIENPSEIVSEAIRVAKIHKTNLEEASILNSDLEKFRKLSTDEPIDAHQSDEECNIVKAVWTILHFCVHPKWGGGASEVFSSFLDLVPHNSTLLKKLLDIHFSF
jgi:hypothetical protein